MGPQMEWTLAGHCPPGVPTLCLLTVAHSFIPLLRSPHSQLQVGRPYPDPPVGTLKLFHWSSSSTGAGREWACNPSFSSPCRSWDLYKSSYILYLIGGKWGFVATGMPGKEQSLRGAGCGEMEWDTGPSCLHHLGTWIKPHLNPVCSQILRITG